MPTRRKVNRCPLENDQRQAGNLSGSLGRVLRRMRRDLLACEECARRDDCPVLQAFEERIQQAIRIVNSEFAALRREQKQGTPQQ
jgi:hypothetical protein